MLSASSNPPLISPAWLSAWIDDDSNDIHEILTTSTPKIRCTSRTLAPNLIRRAHRKSRAGCFSCKVRKIKCGEEKPMCSNCYHKSADCVYPIPLPTARKDSSMRHALPDFQIPLSTTLSSRPGIDTSFTLEDMRFYHHFLTMAYPRSPLGSQEIWISDVPQFATEHTYLMHAMLALGATHLDRLTNSTSLSPSYNKASLFHRGLAIAGLNSALAQSQSETEQQPSTSRSDAVAADAMLATCYALTFQSSYMTDGMSDFLTFIRGCSLVTAQICTRQSTSAFHPFSITNPSDLPSLDPGLIHAGLSALTSLSTDTNPLITTSRASTMLQTRLHAVYSTLLSSSTEAHVLFTDLYTIPYDLSPAEFQAFLDPENHSVRILLAFFVALQALMLVLTRKMHTEKETRDVRHGVEGMRGWVQQIVDELPAELRVSVEWPRKVVEEDLGMV